MTSEVSKDFGCLNKRQAYNNTGITKLIGKPYSKTSEVFETSDVESYLNHIESQPII